MRPFYLADVQRKILEQHAELRVRIQGLRKGMDTFDKGMGGRSNPVRGVLLRFVTYFEAHLAFEERELAPRIRELDAWGPVREAALRLEHEDQRRRIARVCARVDEGATSGVTAQLVELVDGLLEDMALEENMLEDLAAIDEHGHADQMTG